MSHEKVVKTLITLTALLFILIGCAPLVYEETQKRDTPERANANDTEAIKRETQGQLLGTWRFIGIELDTEPVNAATETASPITSALRPTEQTEPVGTADTETVKLPPIAVETQEDNRKIAAAKLALVAANRKNLTLEFYEERGICYYRGSNRGRQATGRCTVITPRFSEAPFPMLRFRRRTGPKMLEFLFSSEPARLRAARAKQAYAENMQRTEGKNYVNTNQPAWWGQHENVRQLGGKGSETAAPKGVAYNPTAALGIHVTAARLIIVLHGDMELTPNGWQRTGGLHCIFERTTE